MIILCKHINMSIDSGQTFVAWLDAQENILELSDYELAKKGNFSHSALSRARKEGIPPGWEICVKIAGVIGISPITVFRQAGLLPPGPDDKINFEDWQHLLEKMTEAEREEFWRFGMMKLEMRQEKEKAARAGGYKAGKVVS